MDFMKIKGYALIVADVSVYHLPEAPAEVAANAGAAYLSPTCDFATTVPP